MKAVYASVTVAFRTRQDKRKKKSFSFLVDMQPRVEEMTGKLILVRTGVAAVDEMRTKES